MRGCRDEQLERAFGNTLPPPPVPAPIGAKKTTPVKKPLPIAKVVKPAPKPATVFASKRIGPR